MIDSFFFDIGPNLYCLEMTKLETVIRIQLLKSNQVTLQILFFRPITKTRIQENFELSKSYPHPASLKSASDLPFQDAAQGEVPRRGQGRRGGTFLVVYRPFLINLLWSI